MTLNAPAFWNKKNSVWKTLLTPASCLYNLAYSIKSANAEPYNSQIPVICVGNVTVGGSGKTPVVQSLIQLVKDNHIATSPFILSRGYGGTKDLHQVLEDDTFLDVGDEPVLLLKSAPVFISSNRAAGAKMIVQQGADLIIMDDGFQNFTLKKDLSLLVVDGTAGFGNQALLPAGPLREPLEKAFERTNAIIIMNDDTYGVRDLIPANTPVFEAHIEPKFSGDKNIPYIGFCGIGQPGKFQKTLEDLKLDIQDFMSFGDHHAYNEHDVQALIKKAEKNQWAPYHN